MPGGQALAPWKSLAVDMLRARAACTRGRMGQAGGREVTYNPRAPRHPLPARPRRPPSIRPTVSTVQ